MDYMDHWADMPDKPEPKPASTPAMTLTLDDIAFAIKDEYTKSLRSFNAAVPGSRYCAEMHERTLAARNIASLLALLMTKDEAQTFYEKIGFQP